MARVLITSGLAAATVNSAAVQAAAWSLSEQASVSTGYDDNVLLSATQDIHAANASTNLSAHVARQSDAFSLTLDPRINVVKYENYSVLNRTEQYLTLMAQQQTELGAASLSGAWTQDTTLTSELGLTGFSQTNKRHQSAALTIADSKQWTERWGMQTQLYIASNHYMDAANTGLVNYNYGAAQFEIDYVTTESSQLSLQASLGKLQVPEFTSYGKTNASATLNYSVSLAQRWQAKLSFGPSRVRSDVSSEQGTIYAASINRQSEVVTTQLSVSRDITPTGQGVLTQREQINLTFSKSLTERLSLGLSAASVKNSSFLLAYGITYDAVRYSDFSTSLSWQMAPTWTLSLSAVHTEQRAEADAHSAIRNQISLNVVWSGRAHSPRRLLN